MVWRSTQIRMETGHKSVLDIPAAMREWETTGRRVHSGKKMMVGMGRECILLKV